MSTIIFTFTKLLGKLLSPPIGLQERAGNRRGRLYLASGIIWVVRIYCHSSMSSLSTDPDGTSVGDCWTTPKSEKTQCQQLSGLFLPFQFRCKFKVGGGCTKKFHPLEFLDLILLSHELICLFLELPTSCLI